jgi:hypothetical protein
MKIFKGILLCAVSSIMTLSIFFNLFFLSMFGAWTPESFKKALLGKELLDAFTNVEQEVETPTDTPIVKVPDTDVPDTESNTDTEVETPESGFGLQENEVVYSENGITITYLKQESSLFGPSFKFCVTNNSNEVLWVSATNVYIDDVQADVSGGSASDIEIGKKAFFDLILLESEYEDFTEYPTKVEFDIKIYDDDTWDVMYIVENLILQVK